MIQWLRDEEDEDEEEPDLDWALEPPSPPHRLPSDPLLVPMRPQALVGVRGWAGRRRRGGLGRQGLQPLPLLPLERQGPYPEPQGRP